MKSTMIRFWRIYNEMIRTISDKFAYHGVSGCGCGRIKQRLTVVPMTSFNVQMNISSVRIVGCSERRQLGESWSWISGVWMECQSIDAEEDDLQKCQFEGQILSRACR